MSSTAEPDDDVTVVLDPGGTGHRIQDIWAWTTVHSDGDESIVATLMQGTWMPLIASDRDRLSSFEPVIESFRQSLPEGKSLKLLHFSGVEVVEERSR